MLGSGQTYEKRNKLMGEKERLESMVQTDCVVCSQVVFVDG